MDKISKVDAAQNSMITGVEKVEGVLGKADGKQRTSEIADGFNKLSQDISKGFSGEEVSGTWNKFKSNLREVFSQKDIKEETPSTISTKQISENNHTSEKISETHDPMETQTPLEDNSDNFWIGQKE